MKLSTERLINLPKFITAVNEVQTNTGFLFKFIVKDKTSY